jgi:hypothetical protein
LSHKYQKINNYYLLQPNIDTSQLEKICTQSWTVITPLTSFGSGLTCFYSSLFYTPAIKRFKNQSLDTHLWTDHLCRFGLAFTLVVYTADCIVKYIVDGDQSIPQKALFIHHIASFFIIMPIITNKYIPWWVNPIGFLHGIIVFFH